MKIFATKTALADAHLVEGQFVETRGGDAEGDNEAARYYIISPGTPGDNDILLANGNIAQFKLTLSQVIPTDYSEAINNLQDTVTALSSEIALLKNNGANMKHVREINILKECYFNMTGAPLNNQVGLPSNPGSGYSYGSPTYCALSSDTIVGVLVLTNTNTPAGTAYESLISSVFKKYGAGVPYTYSFTGTISNSNTLNGSHTGFTVNSGEMPQAPKIGDFITISGLSPNGNNGRFEIIYRTLVSGIYTFRVSNTSTSSPSGSFTGTATIVDSVPHTRMFSYTTTTIEAITQTHGSQFVTLCKISNSKFLVFHKGDNANTTVCRVGNVTNGNISYGSPIAFSNSYDYSVFRVKQLKDDEFVIGNIGTGEIQKYSFNGSSFTPVGSAINFGGTLSSLSISVIDENKIIACTPTGLYMYSYSGTSWTLTNTDTNYKNGSITLITRNTAFFTGPSGNLKEITFDGTKWLANLALPHIPIRGMLDPEIILSSTGLYELEYFDGDIPVYS